MAAARPPGPTHPGAALVLAADFVGSFGLQGDALLPRVMLTLTVDPGPSADPGRRAPPAGLPDRSAAGSVGHAARGGGLRRRGGRGALVGPHPAPDDTCAGLHAHVRLRGGLRGAPPGRPPRSSPRLGRPLRLHGRAGHPAVPPCRTPAAAHAAAAVHLDRRGGRRVRCAVPRGRRPGLGGWGTVEGSADPAPDGGTAGRAACASSSGCSTSGCPTSGSASWSCELAGRGRRGPRAVPGGRLGGPAAAGGFPGGGRIRGHPRTAGARTRAGRPDGGHGRRRQRRPRWR